MFFLVRQCAYVRTYVYACVRVCGCAFVSLRVCTCGGREGIIHNDYLVEVYIMTIN